jgi:tol-pal system protein YbgF
MVTQLLPFWHGHARRRGGALLWTLCALVSGLLPLSGCVTRATGPDLPYVRPAYSVPNPNPDPASLHMSARLQDLEVEMQRLRDMVERLKAQPSPGTEHAITRLQERVAFIERQLGVEAAAEPATTRVPAPTPPEPRPEPEHKVPNQASAKPSPAVPGLDAEPSVEIVDNNAPTPEEQQFREAYGLLRRGSTDQSVSLFEDFLKKYPKSRLAPDAVYWIGEARFAAGRFDEAVLQFDRVIKEFPGSRKELNALLKQGLAFEKMGDRPSAKIIFQKLVQEKPHTPQARIASTRLKALPPD